MKKYIFHITSCLIIFLLLSGCITLQPESLHKYKGTLLFRNSISSSGKEVQGLIKIELPQTEQSPVGINGLNARFTNSNEQILVEQTSNICLYNTVNNELSPIYPKISSSTFCSISYVNENRFTVVEDSKLFLIDLSSNEKVLLADDVGNSFHDSNNNFVYYSINPEKDIHKICRLNIETGHKEILFDGIHPRISKDGKRIAYYTFKSGDELIVKDLETKQSWVYGQDVVNYCFSPDGLSLAIVEYWNGNGYYDGNSICIWDYVTNQKNTILPKYPNGQCVDIDWIN